MLNNYMESNQYYEMIEKTVDESSEFKATEKIYLDVLKSLDLDRKVYDSIDGTATLMMAAARELAYKKGFQDGVKMIIECISLGVSKPATDFNSLMENKDFREAWNRRSTAHNKFVDMLEGFGVKFSKIRDSIEELESASVDYGTTMTVLKRQGIKVGDLQC